MASASLPYQVVTDRIIEKLEQGTVPWHQPWSTELPKSLTTKKDYRGINVFLLGSQGYTNPYWLTFKQGKRLGGHIRRGEKATPIVFWKWIERETEEVDEAGKRVLTSAPMLRYYHVFNLEQCEGIESPEFKTHQTEPIPRAESIVAEMPNRPVTTARKSLWQKWEQPSSVGTQASSIEPSTTLQPTSRAGSRDYATTSAYWCLLVARLRRPLTTS